MLLKFKGYWNYLGKCDGSYGSLIGTDGWFHCSSLRLLPPEFQSTLILFLGYKQDYYTKWLLLQVAQIMVDLLRTSPVHLKIFLEEQNKIGWTAFLLSCYQKDYAVMELLLEAGADIRALDRNENSALMIALINTLDFPLPTKEQCPSIYEVYFLKLAIHLRFYKRILF